MLKIAVIGPDPAEVSAILDRFADAATAAGKSVFNDLSDAPPNAEILVLDAKDVFWKEIVAKKPRMVVTSDPAPGADFVLPAEPECIDRLIQLANERPDWERVGAFGAASGGLEMSLGSALHTIRMPFTGLVMSTAQTAMMIVAAHALAEKQRVAWVSFISAGLKAFSPSGSRIGPMIGITSQGLLFAIVIRVMGWNALSVSVAGALIAAWAGAQGFLIYVLLLGRSIEMAYDEITKWVKSRVELELPGLIALVTVVLILHAIVGGLVAYVTYRKPTQAARRMESWIANRSAGSAKKRTRIPWTLIIATVLVVGILASAGRPSAEIALITVRAVGVGVLLLAVAQRWNPVRLLSYLKRTGRLGQAYALSSALESRQDRKD